MPAGLPADASQTLFQPLDASLLPLEGVKGTLEAGRPAGKRGPFGVQSRLQPIDLATAGSGVNRRRGGRA